MIHAQNEAELTLQWTLTSAAARHCIALGYHREDCIAQLPPGESEAVRRIFWQVYLHDKNLSLRLGKTSVIQDFDVDILQVPISTDARRAPWDRAFVACTQFAQISGNLYERLYSSSARRLSLEERRRVVSILEASLTQWYDEWNRIDSTGAVDKNLLDRTFEPMHIIYYSTLALLYRGETTSNSNSTSDISQRCFEAARQGLQAHLAYSARLPSSEPRISSTYSLW